MYIVTGGAGFIGSAVVWKLNSLGIDDILVVDNLGCTEKWKNLVNRRFTDYMHRDAFLAAVQADTLPKGVKAVFHLGACSATTERDVDFLFRNNLEYSKTLARYALEKNIRFINASSAATYGDGSQGFDDAPEKLQDLRPLNAYGYSKQLFDLWALRTGALQSMASVKFFNVYGPNEYHKGDMRSVVHKAFAEIGATGKMRLFASNHPDFADGGQMRDFIYVKDCAEVLWFLAEHPAIGGVFNLGTGQARPWNDLARAVFAAMGRQAHIVYTPMPEHLAGKYQNFTQAAVERLTTTGCTMRMHSLEQGVMDYVTNYLANGEAYL